MWEVSEIQKSNELACMPEHVKFIPIFNFPGHTYDVFHAVVKAFEDYMNPGDEVSHNIIRDLFNEDSDDEDFFMYKEEWENRDHPVWNQLMEDRDLSWFLACLERLCPEGWSLKDVGNTCGFARD